MSDKKVLMSLRTFSTRSGKVINRGDLIREGHPLLEEYGDMFGDVSVRFEHVTEQATAAPNEVRSVDLSHMGEDEPVRAHENMPIATLKDLANKVGVPNYGTKPELAKRINKKLGE